MSDEKSLNQLVKALERELSGNPESTPDLKDGYVLEYGELTCYPTTVNVDRIHKGSGSSYIGSGILTTNITFELDANIAVNQAVIEHLQEAFTKMYDPSTGLSFHASTFKESMKVIRLQGHQIKYITNIIGFFPTELSTEASAEGEEVWRIVGTCDYSEIDHH